MKVVCALLVLYLVSVTAAKVQQLQFVEEWTLWKTKHGKSYDGAGEEGERHSVWLANREFVLSHNSNWQEHGFSLSLNQFVDMVRKSTKLASYI